MFGEQLTVRVGADISEFNSKMGQVSGRVKNLAGSITKFGAMAAAAFVGFGAAGIARFAKVDQSVREITSLMDNVSKNTVPNLTKQVKDLSAEFGKQKETIARAQYQIVSAGFRDMAESSLVLKETLKLSTAGLADVGETADVVTSILNAYKLQAGDARRVSDILFQTVKYGKTTLTELASSMGEVMQPAYAAGVSLEEVAAAMATTTVQGINTAESATAIKQAIISLAAPTTEAEKTMKKFGIVTKDASGNMLPLLDVMKQFEGMKLEQLRDIIPNIRAAKAVLALAGSYDTLRENVEAMTGAAGTTQVAFEKMAESPQMALDRFKQSLDNLLVTLGEALMPVVTDVMDSLMPVIKSLGLWIGEFKVFIQETGNGLVVVNDLVGELGTTTRNVFIYIADFIKLKLAEIANSFVNTVDLLGVYEKLGIKQFTEETVADFSMAAEQSSAALEESLGAVSEYWEQFKTGIGGSVELIVSLYDHLVNSSIYASEAVIVETEKIAEGFQQNLNLVPTRAMGNLGEYLHKQVDKQKVEYNKSLKNTEAYGYATKGVFSSIGSAIGENFGRGAEGAKNALKSIINTLLDAAQAANLTAKGMALAKGIFSFGVSLVGDLAAVAAATAALQAAKAFIGSRFHSGGIVPGSNEEVPAWLLPGESVLNRSATSYLGEEVINALNAGRGSMMKAGDNIVHLNNQFDISGGGEALAGNVSEAIYRALENLQDEGKIEKIIR
jgi:TP901 family phage tail tape measure protein